MNETSPSAHGAYPIAAKHDGRNLPPAPQPGTPFGTRRAAAFPTGQGRVAALPAVFALWSALALPAFAQEPQTQSPGLKAVVVLAGANSANDAVTMPVPPGKLDLDLYVHVEKALKGAPEGTLAVTNLQPQTANAPPVMPKIVPASGQEKAGEAVPAQLPLAAPGLVHLKLVSDATLRPATTYKGTLFLAAGELSHRWEVTLTTGPRGILAVEPVDTLKFSIFPFYSATVGSFSFSLWGKSDGGPFSRVRVRFEPPATAAGKAITSNFSLDSFSFWEKQDGGDKAVDLEGRRAAEPLAIDNRGQRTLVAKIASLSPGEYAGALRFVAEESAEDSPESKLALTIQIRHHWALPVVVILFGSLVGWYSSKYVVGVRKARDLARQVAELRARADFLARPEPSRSGWEFSSESTSYALARVRVMLSQLAKLSASALPILLREQEIQQQRADAERRLAALEALHETRTKVQPVADSRPAAQLALGRLLRHATSLLDRPTFLQAEQTEFAELLKAAGAWLAEDTRNAKYRDALAERRSSDEIPVPSLVQALPSQHPVRAALEALCLVCPTVEAIRDPAATFARLEEYDQTLGKLALLWRERKHEWATELAAAHTAGASLEALFSLVDEKLWGKLVHAANLGQLKVERDPTSRERPETYDLVDVHLKSAVPEVKDDRILHHPLRIFWHILPSAGNARQAQSDGLTLVQYFSAEGKVKVTAELCWEDRKASLPGGVEFEVVANPDYSRLRLLGGFTEWGVLAIATGFAVATAMSALYDSTFGSFSQYLALFLWAAGAGTGGNIFKQLGSTSTPGGQADATLPGTVAAGK